MRLLTSVIALAVRNIKPKRQVENQTPKVKTKLTEEEITEMGQYRMEPKSRNFKDIFKQKAQEKLIQDYLKKQKEDIRDDVEQDIEQKLKDAPKRERKSKQQKKEAFKIFRIYKHMDKIMAKKKEKEQAAAKGDIMTNQERLNELTRVRLIQQYLPYEYMKRVQKVFHKYDQTTLRDIAFHFTNLMQLRYNQEKIDYDLYEGLQFQRLEDKLPFHRKVEQIYLTSKEKALQVRDQSQRKTEDSPQDVEIKYSQNIITSYLLNRVPRTYSVAYRVLHQLRKMFDKFQPTSFLDFGAGLSCGSAAFVEMFGDSGSVFSVQPVAKMRKLAKFLTDYSKIVQFQSLAELSSQVKQVDVVYCGYVLNQLKPQLVPVYLEALYAKVKPQGFLILTEYGNPFGARLIHESRKWAIAKKNNKIVAPCPHQMKCPLSSSKHWCHFDQPAGMLPREVFGRLPCDNSIKLQKFSYLVIQKIRDDQEESNHQLPPVSLEANESKQWDRVLFPLIRRGKHFLFNLCTKSGKFTRKIAAKSHGGEYKLGRKLKWGDFWRFGARIPNRYRKQRRTGKRLW